VDSEIFNCHFCKEIYYNESIIINEEDKYKYTIYKSNGKDEYFAMVYGLKYLDVSSYDKIVHPPRIYSKTVPSFTKTISTSATTLDQKEYQLAQEAELRRN